MVAIKNHEADRFLAKPPGHVIVFLVHGNDPGLISERVGTILRHSGVDRGDPFQFVRLDGDDIASDPLRLADEANTIGLFGGRRTILIDSGGKNFAGALEPISANPPKDCLIVIEAGSLRKDAPLRKLCERDKFAVSIECYPDESRDIARVIDDEAAAAGLVVEPDAREMLTELLGADRLVTRSELSKLMMYAHGKGHVRVEDVEAVVTDASALAMDAAVNGAFTGDFTAISETSSRIFATGGDAGVLLGAALRHAMLLHRMRLDIDRGVSAEPTYGRAPPRAQAVQQQARQWKAEKLARAIDTLSEAVRRTRREPRLDEAIAIRALWAVALAARNPGA